MLLRIAPGKWQSALRIAAAAKTEKIGLDDEQSVVDMSPLGTPVTKLMVRRDLSPTKEVSTVPVVGGSWLTKLTPVNRVNKLCLQILFLNLCRILKIMMITEVYLMIPK